MQVAALVVSWIVTTALTFAIVLLDERWMSEDRLERAWPPSSRDVAIVAFGPLALIVHFLKTRPRARRWWLRPFAMLVGMALAILSVLVVAVATDFFVEELFELLGIPLPP